LKSAHKHEVNTSRPQACTHPHARARRSASKGAHVVGVVSCSRVRYRVPMQASILDEPGAADPLFRLNTDMYRFSTS
jgi:hypothetical protein